MLLDLPDVIVYQIISYVAPSLQRSSVICHQIAPLCKQSYNRFILDPQKQSIAGMTKMDNNSGNNQVDEHSRTITIWDAILQEDYDINTPEQSHRRRTSKRLRLSTLDLVRNAHVMTRERTENAFSGLHVLSSCGSGMMMNSSRCRLSLPVLKRVLVQYGPTLMINTIQSSGGVFLVEVCRGRNVRENVLLRCVKELVENWGANVNVRTNESISSQQTALCVAAARGMVSVVQYLLIQKNANPYIICSGRFCLYTNRQKFVKCINSTPIQFAIAIRDAEIKGGCNEISLTGLNKCIKLLQSSMLDNNCDAKQIIQC